MSEISQQDIINSEKKRKAEIIESMKADIICNGLTNVLPKYSNLSFTTTRQLKYDPSVSAFKDALADKSEINELLLRAAHELLAMVEGQSVN